MNQPRSRGGPRDPDRQNRIARAAVDVVAKHGIEGLTHRRVAAAAAVPLGSTTYHHATLDDLLKAGLEAAVADYEEEMALWASRLDPAALADGLADFLVMRLGPQRPRTIVHYELYVAAVRRAKLRPLATRWTECFRAVFLNFVDPLAAHALAAALDGLLLEGLISEQEPVRAQLKAVIETVLRARPT